MSRFIKAPICIPDGVSATVSENSVAVRGKRGSLKMSLHPSVRVTEESGTLIVKQNDSLIVHGMKGTNPMLGTTYRLIVNLLIGVTEGFKKTLLINGVGYRAQLTGKVLKLSLGFSHPVEYVIPEGITMECKSQTEIEVIGSDKQLVGQVAADIRSYKRPEPYQGKGVRYSDEHIFRKETKKKK